MNDRSVLGLALATGLYIAALPAVAQHGSRVPREGHGPQRFAHGAAMRVLHTLDLDENQRDEIHGIVHRYREGELGTRVRAVAAARHVQELNIWDPKAREADLAAAAETVAQRAREVDAVLQRMAAEVLAVLTEDQRAEFRTKLSEAPIDGDGPPMGAKRRTPRPAGGEAPER